MELLLVFTRAIVGHPCPADGEQMEPEHIHHTHCGEAGLVQVRALREAGAHKQAPVASAPDGSLGRARVPVTLPKPTPGSFRWGNGP